MADEPKPEPGTNPNPEPPKTPDLVQAQSKQIRDLQDRLTRAEAANTDSTIELKSLRDIVRKLGELPPRNPAPKRRTLLQEIEDMIWPSSVE